MKLTINKKEANAVWVALHYYLYEATHDQPDGEAKPGLPEGEEKVLMTSVANKLLKETRKGSEKNTEAKK